MAVAELASRSTLEQDFAEKMGRLSERHRQELVRLLGNPPNPKNVTQEDWDRWEREDRDELLLLLLLIFLASAQQHASQAVGPDAAADVDATLQQQAAVWAATRADDIASGMADNSRAMLQEEAGRWVETRREAEQAATEAGEDVFAAREFAHEAITEEMVEDFSSRVFGPTRIEGIAITETTGAISAGGDAGIEETVGVSQEDLWITEKDSKVCPVCKPLDNQPRSEWGAYLPDGPPAHPRCRCYLQYSNVGVPVHSP